MEVNSERQATSVIQSSARVWFNATVMFI